MSPSNENHPQEAPLTREDAVVFLFEWLYGTEGRSGGTDARWRSEVCRAIPPGMFVELVKAFRGGNVIVVGNRSTGSSWVAGVKAKAGWDISKFL